MPCYRYAPSIPNAGAVAPPHNAILARFPSISSAPCAGMLRVFQYAFCKLTQQVCFCFVVSRDSIIECGGSERIGRPDSVFSL